jgi:hypothetical protein
VAAVINQAFEVLDKKHENSLTLEQLTKSYNPQNHPHALSRKKSPEDIQAEFVNAISRKADENGRVSQKAFVDYYAELNFCVPNERDTVSIRLFSILNSLLSALGTFKSLKIMLVRKD